MQFEIYDMHNLPIYGDMGPELDMAL